MNKGYFLHVLVLFGFLIFIPVFHFSKATVANQPELNKLLEMVQIHDGTLNEWQLLARRSLHGTVSREELERIVASWKKHFSRYTWTYTKNDDTHIWHGKFYDENLQINERLQLIANLSTPTLQGFIVYEMKGNTLHRSTVQKIHEHYLHTLRTIFAKTPEQFISIKGKWKRTYTDPLEEIHRIARFLRAEGVHLIHEENFVALTAKSPYFSHELKTQHKDFNVQIALRRDADGEETTFAIGTPILMTEY